MKEMVNSIAETISSRLTNSLYGTFFVSWMIFHWAFVFSVFALSDNKIFELTGRLKNDYLWMKYFSVHDWYFWFSWIMPFVLTWLIIWKLPKWVLIGAYKQTESYEAEKNIIRISQQRRVEQEKAKLEEQTAKKVEAVAKQVVQEKRIKEADPTLTWNEDYKRFKTLSFASKFSKIIESLYKRSGSIQIYDNYMEKILFEIPEDILAYAHSNDLIEFNKTTNGIEATKKGKFFIDKFLSGSEIY